MNAKNSELISSYQQYLPAIIQKDAFVGQLLVAFEKILSGINETSEPEKIVTSPGLEEIIDNIHIYFNPQKTPEEFLPWLASWVALSLRDDWQVEVKKVFIQQIVRLYRLRGTKQGLIEILGIYLKNSGFGEKVEVFDEFDDFPNYFQVQLTLKDRDPDKYWRQAKIAKAIIDREKPAQTFYTLKILVPTMQLTKRSHVAYPFKLFEPPQNQKFVIEVIITRNTTNISPINQLVKQLIIQLQGNSKFIITNASAIITDNQSFTVKYDLNYQHLQDNLTGFSVTISNRTDKDFVGKLAIKLYFYMNGKEYSNTLLEQTINLSPVLKICHPNNAGKIIEGNTIFQQAIQPQKSGMRITEYLWSKPYSFQTFEPPKIQELQPEITAILEKLELEAIVEITQPNAITSDILNKIAVRLQDDVSDFHLFIPETSKEMNQIKIKRNLYYQQFMQTIDNLKVTIKNLNNIDIAGRVKVQATLNLNQRLSTYNLLEQTFSLTAVLPYNILEICRKNEEGQVIAGNTILGTTSQSLN